MYYSVVCFSGTSNWSEDYFVTTAGVGLVLNQTGAGCGTGPSFSRDNDGVTLSSCPVGQQSVQGQLAAIFDRDWNSAYAHPLPK